MAFVIALMGLAVGSFLNVCIDRLPARQSLLKPRSHCDVCKTPLATRDLVPILSYLLLRGRCRHCSSPIPIRVPLVESVTGLAFVGCWLYFGQTWVLAVSALITSVLIVILVITFEHGVPPTYLRRRRHGN